MVVFNSASSGGGGGRGAPQHYPKTASNRYVMLLLDLHDFKVRPCLLVNIELRIG